MTIKEIAAIVSDSYTLMKVKPELIVSYLKLGLLAEIAEACEANEEDLIQEMGDVFWFQYGLCLAIGADFEKVLHLAMNPLIETSDPLRMVKKTAQRLNSMESGSINRASFEENMAEVIRAFYPEATLDLFLRIAQANHDKLFSRDKKGEVVR